MTQECLQCDGKGWYVLQSGTYGEIQNQSQCEFCLGTGKIDEEILDMKNKKMSQVKLEICDENGLSLGVFKWCGSVNLLPIVARDKLGDALTKIIEILNLCTINKDKNEN